jgi:hypothetical protein
MWLRVFDLWIRRSVSFPQSLVRVLKAQRFHIGRRSPPQKEPRVNEEFGRFGRQVLAHVEVAAVG